jgi:hypothetical protein
MKPIFKGGCCHLHWFWMVIIHRTGKIFKCSWCFGFTDNQWFNFMVSSSIGASKKKWFVASRFFDQELSFRVYDVSPPAVSPLGQFAAAVPLQIFFLATCYSYFSINLTKRRIFSVSCQCHLFINGLIASQRPRGFSDTWTLTLYFYILKICYCVPTYPILSLPNPTGT